MASKYVLSFEKPLKDLEEKIEATKRTALERGIDMTKEIQWPAIPNVPMLWTTSNTSPVHGSSCMETDAMPMIKPWLGNG
jgi:hypothetical protein